MKSVCAISVGEVAIAVCEDVTKFVKAPVTSVLFLRVLIPLIRRQHTERELNVDDWAKFRKAESMQSFCGDMAATVTLTTIAFSGDDGEEYDTYRNSPVTNHRRK